MIWNHHRFKIFNQSQHPFKHSGDDIFYSHPALGSGSDIKKAVDWLFNVLYPNAKGTVDTPLDLPVAGNAIYDYYIVSDDGDGKAAGYRWDQWEGEATPSWHKIYDFDWGEETVLSGFLDKTQDIYVKSKGYDDLDKDGNPVTGDLAGQKIYGGASANTHLTLFANSGDGTGPNTGYIQFGDSVRPTADNTFPLGNITRRFSNVFSLLGTFGTLALAGGSITDSSGAISFGDENLSTSGNVTVGTLLLAGGSITDTSGTINFGDENLTTTGTVSGATGTFTSVGTTNLTSANLTLTGFSGVLKAALGVVSASAVVNADIDAAAAIELTKLASVTASRALVSDGSGKITASTITTTKLGYLSDVTGPIQSQLDGKASTLLNNLAATTLINSFLSPATDNTIGIGTALKRWSGLFAVNIYNNASDFIPSSVLTRFKLAGTASDGDGLFWDAAADGGAGAWVASAPDSEIDHGTITGLLDDDHTQYALLAGRAGGQTIIGGTANGNALILRGSSAITKGGVKSDDNLLPHVDNTYNLGSASLFFKDIYSKGQHYNLRVENVAGLPGASAANVGRLVYNTDNKDLSVDEGGIWRRIGVERGVFDSVWNGSETSKIIATNTLIDDAREAIWVFQDVANDYVEMNPEITKTQNNVTITFGIAPPAGTYRLRGIR